MDEDICDDSEGDADRDDRFVGNEDDEDYGYYDDPIDDDDDGDEPSSSVGLYFCIFAHFGSRVTLTVTLLSSQCYYCPAEVISLFGQGHFIVFSF